MALALVDLWTFYIVNYDPTNCYYNLVCVVANVCFCHQSLSCCRESCFYDCLLQLAFSFSYCRTLLQLPSGVILLHLLQYFHQ